MPVIINDFEIIDDASPPRSDSSPAEPSQGQPEARTLNPEDVVRIARHEQQRHERLRAD